MISDYVYEVRYLAAISKSAFNVANQIIKAEAHSTFKRECLASNYSKQAKQQLVISILEIKLITLFL